MGGGAETLEQATLDEAAGLAIDLFVSRLKDKPDDVPNHVLARFVNDCNRIAERRANEIEPGESRPFSVLDEIATLPPARAIELLDAEIVRLTEELSAHQSARESYGQEAS